MKIVIKNVPTKFLMALAKYIEDMEEELKKMEIKKVWYHGTVKSLEFYNPDNEKEKVHIWVYRTKTAINFRGQG